MWAPNFTELWYGYGAMNQETTSLGERQSLSLKVQLSLLQHSVTATYKSYRCPWSECNLSPAPGQRNRPPPSQADFSCSAENHFILFSGVWWIELPARRKRETRTAALVSSYVAMGWFYPHCVGWAGWSEQPHGGRMWWVISWICSADWVCFGLDRASVWTVCCKEQYCWGWWSLAGSLPSVPGPVAVEFLLVISIGTGQFTSLL